MWCTPLSAVSASMGQPFNAARADDHRVRGAREHAGGAAAATHASTQAWLVSALGGDEAVGLCLPVVSGMIPGGTSHRVFAPPSTHDEVFAFLTHLAAHPNTTWVKPGRQHLRLLERLCRAADARGDLVGDAVISALAIEAGATVVTYDRDFDRFPDVRWRTPARVGSRRASGAARLSRATAPHA